MPARRAVRRKPFRPRKAADRRKFGAPEVPLLAENAPIGTYRLDHVADELLPFGVTPSNRVEFVKAIRRDICFAAEMAVSAEVK